MGTVCRLCKCHESLYEGVIGYEHGHRKYMCRPHFSQWQGEWVGQFILVGGGSQVCPTHSMLWVVLLLTSSARVSSACACAPAVHFAGAGTQGRRRSSVMFDSSAADATATKAQSGRDWEQCLRCKPRSWSLRIC